MRSILETYRTRSKDTLHKNRRRALGLGLTAVIGGGAIGAAIPTRVAERAGNTVAHAAGLASDSSSNENGQVGVASAVQGAGESTQHGQPAPLTRAEAERISASLGDASLPKGGVIIRPGQH